MFAGILNYFFGYVKFIASGPFCERFVNLCGINNRDIWNIKKCNDGLVCYTKAKEYKNLRVEARKSQTKIKIIKKFGMPFMIHKNRHRYGIPVGVVSSVILLSILSGYVWNIDVSGNKALSKDAIHNSLNEYGVYVGMKKSNLDPPNIREGIMAKYDGISWMSINPTGTTLYVNISERTVPPDVQNNSEPCHIVAKCDGIIKSIKVTEGRAMVKEGDAVVKGDLLVSGIVEYSNGAIVMKQAKGEVIAQTYNVYSAEIPFLQENLVETGRIKTRNVLNIFNISIPLYIGELNENWVKTVVNKPVIIDGVELPFGITQGVFTEIKKENIIISVEKALEIGKNDIADKMKIYENTKNFDLVDEIVKYDENSLKITQKFSCVENVGISEKVLIF